MDAITALAFAAQGSRLFLGDYPTPGLFSYAVANLTRQAEALAEVARLEADADTPAATIGGDGLIVEAARRRVAALLRGRTPHRDMAVHADACPVGCDHAAILLLRSDRALADAISRDARRGLAQEAVATAVTNLGRTMHRAAPFLVGGLTPLNAAEDDDDDGDEDELPPGLGPA